MFQEFSDLVNTCFYTKIPVLKFFFYETIFLSYVFGNLFLINAIFLLCWVSLLGTVTKVRNTHDLWGGGVTIKDFQTANLFLSLPSNDSSIRAVSFLV